MKKSIVIISALVTLFFFGEIALTFSDDGNSFIIENEEVAFSLKLENQYSDFSATTKIDEMVEAFIRQWGIKGASVAISKDEELVYAKGFGYANVEKKEEVKPGHLFRIASVSKLITAAAVMKLYEEGYLDLDEHVFGPAGILDSTLFSGYKDKRVEQITVRHLMNHTAGWSKHSGDPMFNSLYIARKLKIDPPAKTDHIIEFTLSRNLNYDPGTRYSYSNLGYGILGRVIEVKSGMPYEDYVIMNLLKPAGIHDMHIGRSYAHEKFPNEVNYYNEGRKLMTYAVDGSGEIVPSHYGGNNIELLGAAGGWVASAPELCKLMTALDGFGNQRDILEKETLEMMVDPELAGMGLFGWRGQDHYGTWWRTGYISGSTALLVRQQDGVNWVILMNTSTYKESRIQRYTSSMMFGAVNSVSLWPYLNLFLVDKNHPGPITEIPVSNPLL
ncbi:MAG: serine hydrolase [Bacteroidales bacterium]|nr:serine hydrolase [Bacteroidales bacterium]MDT8430893.1 serine hydrolase domain-containing protein [Bacteroidales bacterium]